MKKLALFLFAVVLFSFLSVGVVGLSGDNNMGIKKFVIYRHGGSFCTPWTRFEGVDINNNQFKLKLHDRAYSFSGCTNSFYDDTNINLNYGTWKNKDYFDISNLYNNLLSQLSLSDNCDNTGWDVCNRIEDQIELKEGNWNTIYSSGQYDKQAKAVIGLAFYVFKTNINNYPLQFDTDDYGVLQIYESSGVNSPFKLVKWAYDDGSNIVYYGNTNSIDFSKNKIYAIVIYNFDKEYAPMKFKWGGREFSRENEVAYAGSTPPQFECLSDEDCGDYYSCVWDTDGKKKKFLFEGICNQNFECESQRDGLAPGCTGDNDGDNYYNCCECNDSDPNVYPGATEVCDDGIDNDCDGRIDCRDSDCYGTPQCVVNTCTYQQIINSNEKIVAIIGDGQFIYGVSFNSGDGVYLKKYDFDGNLDSQLKLFDDPFYPTPSYVKKISITQDNSFIYIYTYLYTNIGDKSTNLSIVTKDLGVSKTFPFFNISTSLAYNPWDGYIYALLKNSSLYKIWIENPQDPNPNLNINYVGDLEEPTYPIYINSEFFEFKFLNSSWFVVKPEGKSLIIYDLEGRVFGSIPKVKENANIKLRRIDKQPEENIFGISEFENDKFNFTKLNKNFDIISTFKLNKYFSWSWYSDKLYKYNDTQFFTIFGGEVGKWTCHPVQPPTPPTAKNITDCTDITEPGYYIINQTIVIDNPSQVADGDCIRINSSDVILEGKIGFGGEGTTWIYNKIGGVTINIGSNDPNAPKINNITLKDIPIDLMNESASGINIRNNANVAFKGTITAVHIVQPAQYITDIYRYPEGNITNLGTTYCNCTLGTFTCDVPMGYGCAFIPGLQPKITQAFWQPNEIAKGDNVKIAVKVDNAEDNSVNVTVYRVEGFQPPIEEDTRATTPLAIKDYMTGFFVALANFITGKATHWPWQGYAAPPGYMEIVVDRFDNINIINGWANITLIENNYGSWLPSDGYCNATNNCYFYFHAEMADNASEWLDSNRLYIHGAGWTGPLEVNLIEPKAFCDESNQLGVCCPNPRGFAYDASKAIWHNATGKNYGWWKWEGKGENVANNLTIPQNGWGPGEIQNISHTYGLLNGKNWSFVNVIVSVKRNNEVKTSSENILVSNCISNTPPIVEITSPKNRTYSGVPRNIQFKARVKDETPQNIFFEWYIGYKINDGWILYDYYGCNYGQSNCPNIQRKLNYSGQYFAFALANDSELIGYDYVFFTLEPFSCSCDGTFCYSWDLTRNPTERYCNGNGNWENYCIDDYQCQANGYSNWHCVNNICVEEGTAEQCADYDNEYDCVYNPDGILCWWDPECRTCEEARNTGLGCSAYKNQQSCEMDACGLGRTDFDPVNNIIYYGCQWNGTHCLQASSAYDTGEGQTYACSESITASGSCEEGVGSITVTHTFTSDPPEYANECCNKQYGSCSNGQYTETIACPQPPSLKMPGWNWLNAIAVLLLLGIYYGYILRKKK